MATDLRATATWRKLSPTYRGSISRRHVRRDFKAQLEVLTDRVRSARVIARAIVRGQQRDKAMAGGKFFALVDELQQSEGRLDALAEPLLDRLPQLEGRARRAIEAKHANIDAATDCLDRLEGVTKKLEGDAAKDNGGPSLAAGSAELPQPSIEANKSAGS